VPSEQSSSLPISANTLRDDRRALRAHNKQKKADEMAQQQLDDRVRLGQEEAAFALREDEEEQQRLRVDELRAAEVKREVEREVHWRCKRIRLESLSRALENLWRKRMHVTLRVSC
jgi:hypothetical protein